MDPDELPYTHLVIVTVFSPSAKHLMVVRYTNVDAVGFQVPIIPTQAHRANIKRCVVSRLFVHSRIFQLSTGPYNSIVFAPT